jgi:hypothetical protein
MPTTTPRLTFLCELTPAALLALLRQGDVLPALQQLGAHVTLAIRTADLADSAADLREAVRQCNGAGIGLNGWLMLDGEQGTGVTADTVADVTSAYTQFHAWAEAQALEFNNVVLDVRPDHDFLLGARFDRQRFVRAIARTRSAETIRTAQAELAALVKRIHADGYGVDALHFPLIVDERISGSLVLQRISGMVDVRADRDILLTYTNAVREIGGGMLWSYGTNTHTSQDYHYTLAVGSTGGGAALFGPLTWEDLARDLRMAYCRVADIHVHSLEGCVAQGFLPRLVGFAWDAPLVLPHKALGRVRRGRVVLQGALWTWAHPGIVVAGVVGVVETLWRVRRLLVRDKAPKSQPRPRLTAAERAERDRLRRAERTERAAQRRALKRVPQSAPRHAAQGEAPRRFLWVRRLLSIRHLFGRLRRRTSG